VSKSGLHLSYFIFCWWLVVPAEVSVLVRKKEKRSWNIVIRIHQI